METAPKSEAISRGDICEQVLSVPTEKLAGRRHSKDKVLLLSALYLGTGSIWIAILAHALLDVINLVVRPTLTRLVASR